MTQPASSGARARLSELIREVIRGDADALDTWFREEHPGVYRLCFGFLADAAEAEDVAQDAMLHLLDRLAHWDAERPYAAWRDTVVLNQCRDRLRRNEARGRALQGAAELQGASPNTGAADPAAELERREERGIMLECLGELTQREREVFVLRDLEGRSTREAAGLLGIGESTVRSLLTLARRRLRGVLGERLPGLAPGGGPCG